MVVIIVVAAVGVVAAGLTVYWFTTQQQIQAEYDISHREQCNTKAESFKQRALDAISKGQFQSFEEWKNAFQSEAQSLSAECGDVLQPQ